LAAALALEGDLEGAKFALAEAIKLKSEPNSLAQMRASLPYAIPKYVELLEKTVFVGFVGQGYLSNDRDPPSRRDPRRRYGRLFAANRSGRGRHSPGFQYDKGRLIALIQRIHA
jgi:hypothetical protein